VKTTWHRIPKVFFLAGVRRLKSFVANAVSSLRRRMGVASMSAKLGERSSPDGRHAFMAPSVPIRINTASPGFTLKRALRAVLTAECSPFVSMEDNGCLKA